MQPREWVMLALLIVVPLAIAAVVTLWSIKQMAYTPKKPARPKPVLSAEDLAALHQRDDALDGSRTDDLGERAEHRQKRDDESVAVDAGRRGPG